MNKYGSFMKVVGGGEGDRCNYPKRLDTYGKGCANDCSYCYAKSLLDFRKLWNPDNVAVADIRKVKDEIRKNLRQGEVVRLGGMTDCFQASEREFGITRETILWLNRHGIEYLIVTKNPLVADDSYMRILDKDLAHIQVSITTTDDALNKTYEKAEPYSERRSAIEKLYKAGYDVQVRLSPYIPEYIDVDELASIGCDKILVEFLRVNHFISKAFDIDFSEYTLKEGGYRHLPLDKKLEYLGKIHGFDEHSVCDDVEDHYEYFKANYNSNPDDCCNLRRD